MIPFKRILPFLLFLAAAVIFAQGGLGCAPGEPEAVGDRVAMEEAVVKMAFLQEDAPTLDPHSVAGTPVSFNVIGSVFNKLVRFPPGTIDATNIQGDLAREWAVSEDKLTWTFYLREGVGWHGDFGEVTAHDVQYSLERILDPATGCDDRGLYTTIDRIEVEDDYTVHFHMNRPDSLLLTHLAYRFAVIVPRAAMEAYGEDFPLNLVGSGPFIFDAYLPHEKVVLVANPDYFRGPPQVDRLEYHFMPDTFSRFEAFLAGEMDMIQGEPTAAAAEAIARAEREGLEIRYDALGPANTWGLKLDTQQPPFDDLRVRQAIAYALDIDEYTASVMDIPGSMEVPTAAGLVFLEDFFGGTADVKAYSYNPEKARDLLAEAEFPGGEGFSFSLHTIDTFIQGPGLFIQAALADVGVDVELVTQDVSTWLGTTIPEAVHPVQWWTLYMYPEPNRTYGLVYARDAARGNLVNYTGIADLLDEAAAAFDAEVREKLYHEIQKTLAEDCVYIPITGQKFTRLRHAYVDLGYEPLASFSEWYDLTENLALKK